MDVVDAHRSDSRFHTCCRSLQHRIPFELIATGLVLIGTIFTALGVSLGKTASAQFHLRQEELKRLGRMEHPVHKTEIQHLESSVADVLSAIVNASVYGRLGLGFIVVGSVALMIYQAFEKC